MSFVTTCAEELRRHIRALEKLSAHDVEAFLEEKSEIRSGLLQVADMLDGNFRIESETPKKQVQKTSPKVIKAEKGNLVTVDFKARRVRMRDR